ncbi:hypothetical protein BFP97_03795 [Roseivirga sp. 4D4]|uniref:helix-turn-helix domain-containing protein n=1 Tax=Roseivirga sp. 4D4 TaxID=1889784 RepID=UPI000853ED02|nr:DUF4870 domain-containing protein [Roseivirga sp. 4D4]OEK00682.1 hypothetical protein BFP97_03795 [Roseivirga sp. 4D4]
MKSIVKAYREKQGATQADLAKGTGLSLRTIQRLESSGKAPKGHTLTVLSNAFGLEAADFKSEFQNLNQSKTSDTLSIKFINLSALCCVGIPFGNIILPSILWNRNRHSKMVDEVGRKIINFQILWSLSLCLLLSISPFINQFVLPSQPLILFVLAIGFLFNFVVIGLTAHSINKNNLSVLNLRIRLL